MILFETNQIIHVNANVKEIELFIEDSLSNPIIFPLKIPIIDFLQGTELTKEKEFRGLYLDSSFFYIKDTNLNIGDKIGLDDTIATIIDTCFIENKCLMARENHNYSIVKMNPRFKLKEYYYQNISNTPIFHLLIE